MFTSTLKKELGPSNRKRHFQQMGLAGVNCQSICKRVQVEPFLAPLAQVQVDQGPPNKTIYTEYNRNESGKEPGANEHRGLE